MYNKTFQETVNTQFEKKYERRLKLWKGLLKVKNEVPDEFKRQQHLEHQ
jgi:hypothetical protein